MDNIYGDGMKMIELENGKCIGCGKNKITRYGLMCNACAKPYAHIKGDNEQKMPVWVYGDEYTIQQEMMDWIKDMLLQDGKNI